MLAKPDVFGYGSKAVRTLILTLQMAMLAAAWALFHPAGTGLLGWALLYVFLVWTVAGGITFGSYLAVSMAPFSDLLTASLGASANAMWLVPGVLALTTRSPLVAAIGVAVVINSTRLLVLNRPPKGKKLPVRRRHHRMEEREPEEAPLFGYQPEQTLSFSPEMLPGVAGALALQAGLYALAARSPLPAAASFATATALWVSASIAHGAWKARRAAAPYSAPIALLTLLVTATLTAVLMQKTIVQEGPVAAAESAETPGVTRQVLKRLAHVPPAPDPVPAKADAKAPQTVVTTMVDPALAVSEKGLKGIPGVVLRPPPLPAPRVTPVVLPGSRFRFSTAQPLAFPFTGEYELYRTSSGSLPKGAAVESGTPLESVYGTTNGGPMSTVAVQHFDPPLDLANCGKVLVAVTSGELYPVLVMMQLETEGSVEDGGSDLLGMKRVREQMLEFQVPVTVRPLLVRTIRVSFQRPVADNTTNVRIAVKGFTLLARGL